MVAGDELLAQIVTVKYQVPKRRDICPLCGGIEELEQTDRGLHCRGCGWHESGGSYPKYIPRVPDTNTP